MIQRYILYPLNYTVPVIDFRRSVCLRESIRPRKTSIWFLPIDSNNLSFALEFLLQRGGCLEAVEKAALVKKGAMCDLTIPEPRQ